MSRVASKRPLRAFLLGLAGLSLALTSCARFGFELLPALGEDPPDEPRFDAGLTPVTTLDGGVPVGPGGPDQPGGPDASTTPVDPRDAGGTLGPRDAGDGTGGEGSVDSGTPPQPSCTEFGPFDPPVLVTGLGQSISFGPALSDDALTLLFVAGNPYDIFTSSRASRNSGFSAGVRLPDVNQQGIDATPFLTDGGLTLLLASDRFTQQGFNDLMIATRPDLASQFSQPVTIANVNSPAIELSPQQSDDGLRLYFSSDRDNDNRDIWMSSRADRTAQFGSPARVGGLNGQSQEFGPSLSPDELEVFIASDRSGGEGSMDLWRAVRSTRGAAFGTPENVGELNGSGYETDPRLSRDGTELVFSSSRNGNQVLWSARRACVTP